MLTCKLLNASYTGLIVPFIKYSYAETGLANQVDVTSLMLSDLFKIISA